MTVEELLDRMTSREFSEWQAFFGLGLRRPPADDELEDLAARELMKRFAGGA